MRLSRSQRRAVAVSLLLTVLALVGALGVWPAWTMYRDDRESISELRHALERFGRVARSGVQLRRQLEQLREDRTADQMLLAEATSTLAAATLQKRLKRIVQESGGRLTSTQALVAESREGFDRVGVNARMSVNISALQRVLYDLEARMPILLVDELVVLSRPVRRPRRSRRRGGVPELPPAPAKALLDVRFRLTGFMAKPGVERS